jgi:putative sigma-54 modulation protein
MRLELTGRHVTITAGVRKLVDEKLAKTRRMLNDHAVSAQVVLTKEKTRHHADVTLHARGDHFFHGEGTGRDLGSALAGAIGKIDHQAQRLKEKWDGRRRGRGPLSRVPAAARPARAEAAPAAADGAARAPRIIRARRYAVKPMSVEDAAAEIGGGSDAVIVFRNSTTDAVTVLFRRADGNLGLIEPEA